LIRDLRQKSFEQRNFNVVFISKLTKYNKLRLEFRTQNDKIYKEMLNYLATLPKTTLECIENAFCAEVSINTETISKYTKSVNKMYNLSLKIRKEIARYTTPGGVCSGSVAECKKRTRAARNYLRWLDKSIKNIRKQQITLIGKVPTQTTECKL